MGSDQTIKGLTPRADLLDGSELRILILHTRWNLPIVMSLVDGAAADLVGKFKVKKENVTVAAVPGSYELPFACKAHIATGKYDAVIAVGVLIKGGTMHFEYIAESVTHGIMRVQLDTDVPVIFGVLTCLTEDQAKVRAGIRVGDDEGHNHGLDWAAAAVEMALLKKKAA
ncbi:putative 6,7-dimethyl-8-ribityllumazine synthase [Hyaloraphidium curvatum]|nr:putative 6,7-dimethyl-8-ribityllumazine synthase [Hyaloraphidium curvatum]